MSCDLPFFIKEEQLVMETWGKDILDGKYENIFLYFLHTDKNERIEGNNIYVDTSDDIMYTFHKTMKSLKLLEQNNIQYDFILRTNLSTYINVDTFDKFINNDIINNYEAYTRTLFTSEVINTVSMKTGPRGNILLFNRAISKSLINLYDTYYSNVIGIDDAVIGEMIYPVVICRPLYGAEMFNDGRYDRTFKIDSIDDINIGMFFISYRMYYGSLSNGYAERESEFDVCREIHKKIIELKNNL